MTINQRAAAALAAVAAAAAAVKKMGGGRSGVSCWPMLSIPKVFGEQMCNDQGVIELKERGAL